MSFRIVYAALLLASSVACGSSSPAPAPTPVGSTKAASIVANSATLTTTAYSPNPVTVSIGGTVTWTNNDTIAHTSTADGGAWSSGSIAPGGTFRATFRLQGAFPTTARFILE